MLGIERGGRVDDGLVRGRVEGVFTARPARAQHVEADPGHDGGEPGAQVVDVVRVGSAEAEPRFLDRVVGFGARAEHPVRHRAQAGPVLLEAISHSFSFICHILVLTCVIEVTPHTRGM